MNRNCALRLQLLAVATLSVPRLRKFDTAPLRKLLKKFDIDRESGCTVMALHNGTWTEGGVGYCSVSGHQLNVRNKEHPSSLVLQQTISTYNACQQDGHCIIAFTMGPDKTEEQDQLIGLLFDSQQVADRVAEGITQRASVPLINYGRVPSPHTAQGHHCCGLRVMVYNRKRREKEGRGLVCFDSKAHTLRVYVEYEGDPYNFFRFSHTVDLAHRAAYTRTGNGQITLGGSDYTLGCDRRDGAAARDKEDRLWGYIQSSLSQQQAELVIQKTKRAIAASKATVNSAKKSLAVPASANAYTHANQYAHVSAKDKADSENRPPRTPTPATYTSLAAAAQSQPTLVLTTHTVQSKQTTQQPAQQQSPPQKRKYTNVQSSGYGQQSSPSKRHSSNSGATTSRDSREQGRHGQKDSASTAERASRHLESALARLNGLFSS